MNKSAILERLELLVKLCEETEPDIPNDTQLFTEHSISVQGMVKSVRDLHTGKQTIDSDSERNLMITIMRESNKIWKLRNKVKNGEVDTIDHTEMIDEIEDHLAHGQKINAIKYYREEMKVRFGERVTLREAKDFVDSIDDDLKRKGIVRSFTRK